jgi:hypothetical protein
MRSGVSSRVMLRLAAKVSYIRYDPVLRRNKSASMAAKAWLCPLERSHPWHLDKLDLNPFTIRRIFPRTTPPPRSSSTILTTRCVTWAVFCCADMDGRDVDGNRILVEWAKGPRAGGPVRGPTGMRTDFRLTVEGLTSDTSWQDLKVTSCNLAVAPLLASGRDLGLWSGRVGSGSGL